LIFSGTYLSLSIKSCKAFNSLASAFFVPSVFVRFCNLSIGPGIFTNCLVGLYIWLISTLLKPSSSFSFSGNASHKPRKQNLYQNSQIDPLDPVVLESFPHKSTSLLSLFPRLGLAFPIIFVFPPCCKRVTIKLYCAILKTHTSGWNEPIQHDELCVGK
jgi:hypothetical protein